jgi:hypothetical protein
MLLWLLLLQLLLLSTTAADPAYALHYVCLWRTLFAGATSARIAFLWFVTMPVAVRTACRADAGQT